MEPDQFYPGSNAAREYLKNDRGDPARTVSAIYALTSLEYHASVVGEDDKKGSGYYPDGVSRLAELDGICQFIPVSETKHIWGDVGKQINWHEGTGYLRFGKVPLRRGRYERTRGWNPDYVGLCLRDLPESFTFHSQPTSDFYSDIPSVEDIFVFLRYQHWNHAVVGRTSCTIFGKTNDTLPAIINLYNWEQDNKYQRARLRRRHPPEPGHEKENRLEIEHRYIAIALRHIGLHWPTKLSARRKVWLSAIRQLGIAVSQIPRHQLPFYC